jgi:hypothetical protein
MREKIAKRRETKKWRETHCTSFVFREVLGEATCQIKNSNRLSPLLSVMETYYRFIINL